MFAPGESATCPECNLALRPLATLPPSFDAASLDPLDETPPDEEDLGFFYFERGRGPLIVLALVGMAVFAFAPWLEESAPEIQTLTGLQFARLLPWIWAGGVGWVTLFVLVVTRRSVYQMRGSRLAVALLAAMVLSTVALRIGLPIPASPYVPRRFSWGWGLYGAGGLALLALFYARRFGGKPDDLVTQRGRDGSETLH